MQSTLGKKNDEFPFELTNLPGEIGLKILR